MILKVINLLFIVWILSIGNDAFELYKEAESKRETALKSVENTKRKIQKTIRQKKEIEKYLANIDKKKQEIEEVALQVEKVQRKLPAVIYDSDNIGLIRNTSDTLKIRNISVRPSREINNGFYYVKNYEFKGYGTYLQFILLLEKLATSERILNVSDVKLQRRKTKGRVGRYEILDMEATIESYRYNDKHKVDRGFDEIEKKVGNEAKKAATPKKGSRSRKKRK
jgi:Tfp pilus assembly protein PilO